MANTFRYKVNKKVGLNTYIIRYGAGCQCAWLEMQLRVPLEQNPDDFIRRAVHAIENLEKS